MRAGRRLVEPKLAPPCGPLPTTVVKQSFGVDSMGAFPLPGQYDTAGISAEIPEGPILFDMGITDNSLRAIDESVIMFASSLSSV